MAGYDWNAGMSNNAVSAYDAGLLPASKAAQRFGFRSAQAVRLNFRPREWHHTSKHFRCTDFYDVEREVCAMNLAELAALMPFLTRRGKDWLLSVAAETIRRNLDGTDGRFWRPAAERRASFESSAHGRRILRSLAERRKQNEAIQRFIAEGTKAWADVPDAAQWVRELRGGKP